MFVNHWRLLYLSKQCRLWRIAIADFIGLLYFSRFPSRLESHVLISHEYLSQSKLLLSPRDWAALCSRSLSKHQKKFCFVSKPVCMYCIKVRISCKGPLCPALYVYCYHKNKFMFFFKQQPVVVYILTWVLSTSQQSCHWLSRSLCKHFTIWIMTQIPSKTSMVMWYWAIWSI